MCKATLAPGMCLHNLNDRAPSKNPARADTLKLLFRDQKRFLAENYGVVLTPSDRCFDSASVLRVLQKEPVDVPPRVKYVFIAIDPAEGGRNDFALTAQVCIGANDWVVRFF